MNTLKEVKQSFADNSNYLHANDYLIELDNANPDGEEENILWEAGYIRGYEVALKEFKHSLESDYDTHAENINDAIEGLDYLLTN